MSGYYKIKLPPLHEWIVVGVILGGLYCFVWPIVRDSRGPMGDPIPRHLPYEANRVRHPAGFSIVAPPNWSSNITPDNPFPAALALAPLTPGPHARRSKALIAVTDIGQDRPPGLENLDSITFQGQEAYERMKVVREDSFDDPPWSEYELVLRHGKDWYSVRYGIAEERAMLPDEIRRYIGTLRWEQ